MAKRLSVSFDDADETLLSEFGEPGTPYLQALTTWAESRGLTLSGAPSEAALVRLLVRAGAEALREHTLDIGYAQLAIEYTADDHAELRSVRKRYAARTDRFINE